MNFTEIRRKYSNEIMLYALKDIIERGSDSIKKDRIIRSAEIEDNPVMKCSYDMASLMNGMEILSFISNELIVNNSVKEYEMTFMEGDKAVKVSFPFTNKEQIIDILSNLIDSLIQEMTCYSEIEDILKDSEIADYADYIAITYENGERIILEDEYEEYEME